VAGHRGAAPGREGLELWRILHDPGDVSCDGPNCRPSETRAVFWERHRAISYASAARCEEAHAAIEFDTERRKREFLQGLSPATQEIPPASLKAVCISRISSPPSLLSFALPENSGGSCGAPAGRIL
jgi:hypothetical protein